MTPIFKHSLSRFAAAGIIIPLLLWTIIKAQDYGIIGGGAGYIMDQWAFQFLLMLAPLFYHIVAFLQDQSLIASYVIAFGVNAALYAGIGSISTWLLRFPWAYYWFVGLIVASTLIGTDSWFLYRWFNRDELRLPIILNDFNLRYFFVNAVLVATFFIVKAKRGVKGRNPH